MQVTRTSAEVQSLKLQYTAAHTSVGRAWCRLTELLLGYSHSSCNTLQPTRRSVEPGAEQLMRYSNSGYNAQQSTLLLEYIEPLELQYTSSAHTATRVHTATQVAIHCSPHVPGHVARYTLQIYTCHCTDE